MNKPKQKSILVMDNEADILSSMKTILKKQKYDVTCVNTGKKAIKEYEKRKFDLVILDVMMPDLSGWDVFNRIKKINSNQKVIFVSALEVSAERKRQLEDSGVAEYITKPFDLNTFISNIRTIMNIDDKKSYL